MLMHNKGTCFHWQHYPHVPINPVQCALLQETLITIGTLAEMKNVDKEQTKVSAHAANERGTSEWQWRQDTKKHEWTIKELWIKKFLLRRNCRVMILSKVISIGSDLNRWGFPSSDECYFVIQQSDLYKS